MYRLAASASTTGLQPISPWRESPVLLLGDSHALVFHAGEDLHGSGAGLADHLALSLGFPVALWQSAVPAALLRASTSYAAATTWPARRSSCGSSARGS